MARVAVALTCTAHQRDDLVAVARSRTEEARLVERAKIVLACLEGKRNDAVGREFGVRPNTVGLWRKRFAAAGLAGLRDRARPGKTAKYGADLRLRVLRQLELPPPKGLRSEEHTSELQSPDHLVCRLLLEKKKTTTYHAGVPPLPARSKNGPIHSDERIPAPELEFLCALLAGDVAAGRSAVQLRQRD